MDVGLIIESISVLAHGIFLTLFLTLLSLIISFILSVPLSLLRASPNKAYSGAVLAYTYVFRGTPLLVQLFLVYYGLSQLAVVRQSIFWPLLREPFWCALATFSLNSTAYTTEVFRAGILAVPRGVVEAAQALGLSRLMQIRLVIFPLAFRTALPSYANEVIGLVKASSLASTVTLLEITGLARRMVSETFAPYEVFLAAGLLYLLLNFTVSTFFRMLEVHLALSSTESSKNNPTARPMISWLRRLRKHSHTNPGNQSSIHSL
ncbi:ABC transporter permease [Rhizobium bangladeshense]|uniref:ABC transporter permease n=1 Tax=Rhizobium bangladeshense TaxID=1138189 RepID=UPI0007E56D40|nr:ABC transporter permease subunit [Rhizobium bangladeshense]